MSTYFVFIYKILYYSEYIMSTNNEKYLVLRGKNKDIYFIQKRLSKEQASILGKDFIKKSLETTNIHIAKEKRDKILKELEDLTPNNLDISYNSNNTDRFTINNEENHKNELKIHNNSVPIEENHKNTAYEYNNDSRYTIFSLKVPKFPEKDDLIIKIDKIIPIAIVLLTLFIAFIV